VDAVRIDTNLLRANAEKLITQKGVCIDINCQFCCNGIQHNRQGMPCVDFINEVGRKDTSSEPRVLHAQIYLDHLDALSKEPITPDQLKVEFIAEECKSLKTQLSDVASQLQCVYKGDILARYCHSKFTIDEDLSIPQAQKVVAWMQDLLMPVGK